MGDIEKLQLRGGLEDLRERESLLTPERSLEYRRSAPRGNTIPKSITVCKRTKRLANKSFSRNVSSTVDEVTKVKRSSREEDNKVGKDQVGQEQPFWWCAP